MSRNRTSKAKDNYLAADGARDHHKLDALDSRIIDLLCSGYSNSQISNHTRKPLSTIQRRTRQLIERNFVTIKHEPNYRKLGFKLGLLHIYLNDGDSKGIVNEVTKMDYVTSASVHIGNSDIVAGYACKDSGQLFDLLTAIKHLEGVNKIVWSEQVYEAAARERENVITRLIH